MGNSILHRIVAVPAIYNLCQFIAGAHFVQRHLRAAIEPLTGINRVLDLGGGTGLQRGLWRKECLYICLDNDQVKLQGFRAHNPSENAVLGDATQTPIRSGSMDIVLCACVSHHIEDESLSRFISEAMRVLKEDGHLVFVDALWRRSRGISRVLWKYDRGSHPRTATTLRQVLSRHGTIESAKRFAVLHDYLLCIVSKRS